jgi:hypothetical protein
MMKNALEIAPTWKSVPANYAKAGIYHFFQERVPYEVEIGQAVASLAQEPNRPQLLSMNELDTKKRAPLVVSLAQLTEEARWMDRNAPPGSPAAQNWEARIQKLRLQILQENVGMQPTSDLTIDGLLHLIGMVGSGKSSLLTVLMIYMARRGQRVTLIQSDVASLLREMTIIDILSKADPKLIAVPMIGRSTRLTHLNRLHTVEVQKYGITQSMGREHPAYKIFSTVCPLEGLRRDLTEAIKVGAEPCTSLYYHADPSASASASASNAKEINQAEEQTESSRNRRTCPFLPLCPVHFPTRQLSQASIWLATPASLLVSGPQIPLVSEEIRNVELVMRHSDLVLIDEADLVQVQFDNRFAPMEVLIGKGESWLDKLANQVTRQVYRPGRPLVGRRPALDRWLTSHQNTQRAADCLYRWLRESAQNRKWIGATYFSGTRIFSQFEYELVAMSIPLENFRKAREAFRRRAPGSVQNSLDNSEVDVARDWITAIQLELLENNTPAAHNILKRWWEANLPIQNFQTTQIEVLADRLLVVLIINVLDKALQDVLDQWQTATDSLELDYGSGGLFYQPDESLTRLTPEAATGAVLGFQYYDPASTGEGELRFFQVLGVGRDLLYHLHDSYALTHGYKGPNVLLTSGTSWAPLSWRYHLQVKPGAILLPDRKDETAQTECFFEWQSDPNRPGTPLYVSGKSNRVERDSSLKTMIGQFVRRRPNGKSMFEMELERLDENRKRILLVVGSYAEAEIVGETLISELERQEISSKTKTGFSAAEQVLILIPDSEAELDLPSSASRLYRSMLQQFSQTKARYLVAPLQAIERGHNILVGEEAALGSIYFLTRPMPVPGDLQTVVQRLNYWALEEVSKLDKPTLGEAGSQLRQKAARYWDRELIKRETYYTLDDKNDSRKQLLWTQLVMIWQAIGRLLRGGVSARVHFIDAKWLPVKAGLAEGTTDTSQTSMLEGFKEILREALNDSNPVNRAIAQSLYGSFYTALEKLQIK